MNNANDTQAENPQRIAFFEPLGSFDGALIEVTETESDDGRDEGEAVRIA